MDFDILAALEDRSIEVETLADKDRMQIEYINVKDIIPARNDNNFYDTDDVITKCERKAPKFIYGDISSLKNNDSISLFFIVLYF